MAYDEAMADRIRALTDGMVGLTERAMFGGLGFMVNGNMGVAAGSKGSLMVRSEPGQGQQWVAETDAEPMQMNGRSMAGWLLIAAEHLEADDDLQLWVDRGLGYAARLPPK